MKCVRIVRKGYAQSPAESIGFDGAHGAAAASRRGDAKERRLPAAGFARLPAVRRVLWPFAISEVESARWPPSSSREEMRFHRQHVLGTRSLLRSSGRLPHWEVEGAEYFITYRLADSLPEEAVKRLRNQIAKLRKLICRDPEHPTPLERLRVHELVGFAMDAELRFGSGSCLLKNDWAARIVIENLHHHDGVLYDLDTWCVMPNHVHVILRPLGFPSLARILHSLKSYTATMLQRRSGGSGAIWQKEYFDRIIRNDEHRDAMRRYILDNPQAAGLADWPWRGSVATGDV